MDAVDASVLLIQGSGRVKLTDGRIINLNFAGKNGHPFRSIALALKDRLPGGNTSLPTLERYLRSLDRNSMLKALGENPSYVFFREGKERAITASGVPATAGRTIATDPRLFPKGALGVLVFDAPTFPKGDESDPDNGGPDLKHVVRFVVDEDTGGAIKGAGRVDLFWGSGADAKRHAGIVRSWGELYYLVPRSHKTGTNSPPP